MKTHLLSALSLVSIWLVVSKGDPQFGFNFGGFNRNPRQFGFGGGFFNQQRPRPQPQPNPGPNLPTQQIPFVGNIFGGRPQRPPTTRPSPATTTAPAIDLREKQPQPEEGNKPLRPLGGLGALAGGALVGGGIGAIAGNVAQTASKTVNPALEKVGQDVQNVVTKFTSAIPLTAVTWYNKILDGSAFKSIGGLVSSASALAGLAVNLPNEKYEPCTTPKGEKGHVRLLQHCVLPEFAADYSVFQKFMKVVDGIKGILQNPLQITQVVSKTLGVCCPDSYFEPPPFDSAELRPPGEVTTTPKPRQPLPACYTEAHQKAGCGTRGGPAEKQIRRTKRAVGGQDADPYEWPWMASLIKDASKIDYFCGGSLVDEGHVLTAAHCVLGLRETELKIRLGEYDFDDFDSTSPRDFTVSRIIIHPEYSRKLHHNDIAVVKLSESTDFNCGIWPVCLPPKTSGSFSKEIATVTGWGTVSYNGDQSPRLQEVNVSIWEQSECTGTYPQKIISKQLCAGWKEGGRDSCQGDSGGPLVLQQGNSWVQVGIVSYGIRCAEPAHPGVYTRVNEYLDWIEGVIRGTD